MVKKLSLFVLALAPVAASAATPLWLRDAQISPDGKEIVFQYKGDIWKTPAAGGQAVRLTSVPSYEANPIWSPDGKSIAFASDRNGNFDIFVMPAAGGQAARLTFNSAKEIPEAFTPDGKEILFSASIQDPAKSALFPSASLTELYSVPVAGGKISQLLATPAKSISFIPGGKGNFLYMDNKGMENEWRKHHTSSIARDIWAYDKATGKHAKLTINHAGEDRDPVALANGEYYFLSERDGGSMNVYKSSTANPDKVEKITNFKTHPVRFLSRSNDGILCFAYDGEIYTLAPGGKPAKVNIDITLDEEDETYKAAAGKPTEMAVSPNGELVAFISRGDVFVTSADYKTTKQVTNTPEAERHLAWGHDSKTLIFTSERDGIFNIYEAKMAREDDPNFANATLVEEKALIKTDKHERTVPKMSPDGKTLAFVLDRDKLALMDVESGKTRVLTDGSTVTSRRGEITYSWSPDSKWIAMEIIDRQRDPYSDIAIVNVETDEITNLTNTAYFDSDPVWTLNGNAIMFSSDRYGMRAHGSWGSLQDVMIVFLNQEAYNNYFLNEEDAKLAKEAKKDDKKDDKKDANKEDKKEDKKDDKKDDKDKDIKVELDNIANRIVRLTPFSSDLYSYYINSDGDYLFFITKGNSSDNTLWKMKIRGKEIDSSKSISSGLKYFEPSADGKSVFILGSSMQKFAPSSSKLTPVNYSATQIIDPTAEREYMFDYITREEAQRFYDANMHGVDWQALTKHYRKFLPHINNNHDFAEMASEMLGELNVSHTGSGYRPSANSQADRTGNLGLFYDWTYDGKGLKIEEVIADGPFDNADSKAKPGVVVEKINGQNVDFANFSQLLNGTIGNKTLVSLYDPASGDRWEEVVKPISAGAFSDLEYERWIRNRAADVDRWSNGRLGYVHIESMNDKSFREIYADVLGKYADRDGIVIDVRRNGGGRLHEDIEVLFSGNKYLTQVIRGKDVCEMPSKRWNKPSIMVTCEACYSNAHGTPWVYQTQGLGKVVGMPVPGTMTSVNWVYLQDPTLYFGIPVTGYRTAEGYYLENHQLTPDVIIDNAPHDVAIGEDAQLRKAVEELLKEIDNK